MESNFLFFSNTLFGPNIASPPSPVRFLSSTISVIYELYINRETVTSQGHHSHPPILLQDEDLVIDTASVHTGHLLLCGLWLSHIPSSHLLRLT